MKLIQGLNLKSDKTEKLFCGEQQWIIDCLATMIPYWYTKFVLSYKGAQQIN